MITVFNRKELTVTFSMKEQAAIREALQGAGIDSLCKVINRTSPSAFEAGHRARNGTFGETPDLMYEYIIYVKRAEYEKARHVIGK